MKTKYTVALAMAGSFALGAVAVEGLHAQAKPPGYAIAEITVKDQDAYTKEFVPLAVKVMAGGKFLVRGGRTEPMLGSPPASRVIVIQYESFEKAKEWANAQATKEAFAIGQKYADIRQFVVEGLAP
jgi:uncharacterized protein (DUF1330 family)